MHTPAVFLQNIAHWRNDYKIWIFQASRPLSETDKAFLLQEAAAFLSGWAAHGKALKADNAILGNFFWILGVDNAFQQASGCSVDKLMSFVQKCGHTIGIDFFCRTNVVAIDENNQMTIINGQQLGEAIAKQIIRPDSLVFVNTCTTLAELKTQWLCKAGDTWLKTKFARQMA